MASRSTGTGSRIYIPNGTVEKPCPDTSVIEMDSESLVAD